MFLFVTFAVFMINSLPSFGCGSAAPGSGGEYFFTVNPE
jgi:hypothetical protein